MSIPLDLRTARLAAQRPIPRILFVCSKVQVSRVAALTNVAVVQDMLVAYGAAIKLVGNSVRG